MARVAVSRGSFLMKPGAPIPWRRKCALAIALMLGASTPALAAAYLQEYHQPHPTDKAKRVPFEFRFSLVKPKDGHKEVNAFSLAGGPVYVTTDLMDYARSDHELAAVLAHECGHICNHHV